MQKDVPALVPETGEGNLADLPARNAEQVPDRVAFSIKGEADAWSDITWREFNDDVRAIAKGCMARGVQPGDRIALMSRTRYEWTLVDFAAWTAGAVVVPVYETSSPSQVSWILSDSGARFIVVETAAHASTVQTAAQDGHVTVDQTWVIDDGGLQALREAGADVSDADLDERRGLADRSAPATLIYTSGTTGRPKGCELTHGNFVALSENAVARLSQIVKADGAATLLFLPLAHVFARFVEVLCVDAQARMGHSSDIRTLLDDFAAFQPTFVLAVPRVFEKIYNSAEARTAGEGKGRIFQRAADVAIAHSEARDSGGPGLGLRVQHAIFDRLVYGKLRQAMGGKVQYAVSGGGPLGTRLGHFFRGIGVTILEGYGLTETSAPIAVNTPELIKIGTVGPPLPGSSIRVADDGEILVRGNGVFSRYHGNGKASQEAFTDDGWFRTGDLGALDEDGYLTINGRKKEILVTAGGKNVAPAPLEDRLRAHPVISQCIVVGDNRPFVGALITLDEEMWPLWSKANDLEGVPFEQARTNETVLEHIQGAVDKANEAVSRAESIRKFVVVEGDFTEANGYLTPSMKLKRADVLKGFADDVESLYAR